MARNTQVAADHHAPPVTQLLADFVAHHPSRGWSDAVDHEAHRTLMNWLKQLRTRGSDSFFRPGGRSSVPVMTPDTVLRCERLFADGLSVAQVARQAGIGDSTLRKAVARGAVRKAGPDAGTVAAGES